MVNTNYPGTYTLTYEAANSLGHVSRVNRTVIVVDTTAPGITITSPHQLNDCQQCELHGDRDGHLQRSRGQCALLSEQRDLEERIRDGKLERGGGVGAGNKHLVGVCSGQQWQQIYNKQRELC